MSSPYASMFDLGCADVGTQISQVLRAPGAGQDARQVQYADAVQRGRPRSWLHCRGTVAHRHHVAFTRAPDLPVRLPDTAAFRRGYTGAESACSSLVSFAES